MRSFKAGSPADGQRADVFIAGKYPEYSRSALQRLFDEQLISIAGKPVKSGHKLRRGELMRVNDDVLKTEPGIIDIPVIYEDDNVVVMNKPAGMLTHSKGALNAESTVASFLNSKITDDNLSGNRAGIVHRLDRPTSGVIIGAKNETAQKHLQKQFANRKTKKTYVAIVQYWPDPEEAIIDAPIGRNPKKPQTFRVHASGKPAQTHYRVVNKFEKDGQKYAELELKPTTGRTHQLRVHLAYLGHPIVGDNLYGTYGENLLLHARSLELTLPGSERKVFDVVPPAYFKEFTKS